MWIFIQTVENINLAVQIFALDLTAFASNLIYWTSSQIHAAIPDLLNIMLKPSTHRIIILGTNVTIGNFFKMVFAIKQIILYKWANILKKPCKQNV